MARRPLVLVSATLAAALTVLVLVGLRVLERDRDALFAGYGRDREQAMEEAARGLAGEIADIGEDLDLASTLLQGAPSTELAERELHAIATIKREYLAMYARTEAGETTKVTAYDAPPNVAALTAGPLQALLEVADAHPGTVQVSNAFAKTGPAAWYRVFARRPTAHGPVVAVVVDTAVLLGRMKLQRDPMSRTLVLDARGLPAPTGDPALAALVHDRGGPLHALVAATARGTSALATLDGEVARRIGLPDTTAIAVAVPLVVERGAPWTLLVVASAQGLQTQERTIVRRVLVGSVLVLLLLLSAAAYVLHNTFRARALRDRVRMEQRLLHSEKLVTAGQLAAGIAHEIGTPLNVARGRVELALSHLGKDHPEADNHRVVIDQVDRVTRLLQQLLDYVRPAPTAMQPVELAQALHVVRDLLAPQAAKRGVSLRVDAPSDPISLRTDPDQVQQIIVNLSLNAIDACTSGGNVVLRARASGSSVGIEIVDDGHGIPREIHKQVFDPFFTTKKRGQGTGLGLWVVAQLVRAQSAEIELDSTPGHGTTVRVSWPVTA